MPQTNDAIASLLDLSPAHNVDTFNAKTLEDHPISKEAVDRVVKASQGRAHIVDPNAPLVSRSEAVTLLGHNHQLVDIDIDIGLEDAADVTASQIATKIDLGFTPNLPAVIEEEQQNAIADMARLPAPGVQGASQPKTSPITGEIVSGSLAGLPREAANALARSKELTGLISDQLQRSLRTSENNADAMADAISERIGADQIISLQVNTEDMKAQNQLIRVVRASTSEENQARLMNQLHEQAQDLQVLLENRQEEAAAGGMGFLIRSALNKEIYGTPGGKKDIEINAGLKQYQSTLSEIQGVTSATESFQTQNAATREIITLGTIAANQKKIAATGQVELYKVILEQNRSNAETLRSLLSVSSAEMSSIMRGYELANSIQGSQIQREQHALNVARFERQKIMDEVAAKRSDIALRRETLELQIAEGLSLGKIKIQRLAIDQAETTLNRSIIALTIDDKTLDDKLAASIISRATAETNLDSLLLSFRQAEDDALDPKVIAARRSALNAAVEADERATFEFDELKDQTNIRLAQKAGALETQALNIRQQEVSVKFAELMAEGRTTEAFALLDDAAKAREDREIVKKDNVASVQAYQSFIYGAHNVEAPAVIEARIDEPIYALWRRLGATPGPNGEFMLGLSPSKANDNLIVFEGHGIVSSDIPYVKVLREVRRIIEKKHEKNPVSIPTDDIGRAIEFNAATIKYMGENAAEVRFDDPTNPLQPPTIPQLIELSTTLAAQPLFADVLIPAGIVDTNIDTIFSKAIQAIDTGIISQGEAVEGIVTMGNAIGINNNANHHGFQTIGLPYIDEVNMRVLKPRGFATSVFKNTLVTLDQALPFGFPIEGTSNFSALNIVDPVAVRQHLISILSSTTLGGEITEDALDPEEGDK